MSNVLAHVGSGGSGGAAANIYVTGLTDISEKLVPDGYTQLEYISSSGTQYIDTGIAPLSTTTDKTIVATLSPLAVTSDQRFFGCYADNGRNFLVGTTSTNFFGWGGGTAGTATVGTKSNITYKIYETNKYTLTTDETTSTTTDTGTATSTLHLLLFGGKESSTIKYGQMKLYSFAYYDADVLTRNFIPCTNSSGTVGMYDTVGKAFYSSATSTAFTAGPEIVYTTSCTMTSPSGKVKEAIWEKIPIPTETAIEPMTSYTEPEGTMSYSAEYADGAYSGRGYIWGHAAGDGVRWLTYSSQLPAYTEYDIGESKYISKMVIYQSSTSNVQVGTAYVSVDGVKVADVSITTGGATEVDIGVTGQVIRLTLTTRTSTYGSEGAMLHGIMLYVYDPVETNGYICYATEYGTHTVTATNESEEAKTTEVLVDCLADYYINILYNLKLYWDGNEYSNLTGGWNLSVLSSNQAVTKYDTYMYLYTTVNSGGNNRTRASTANLIDVTKYSTLNMTFTNTGNTTTETQYFRSFGLCTTLPVYGGAIGSNLIGNYYSNYELTDDGAHSIDISDIEGSYYIVFFQCITRNTGISRVWLS